MGLQALALASIGTSLLGSGIQAKGQLMAGEAEQQAANFNAMLEEKAGFQKEALIRSQARRHKGKQRAAIGKAGVRLEGSALDALAETAARAEVDATNARKEALLNAEMLRRGGKMAKKGSRLAAGATLLSGLGKAAGSFAAMGSGGGTPTLNRGSSTSSTGVGYGGGTMQLMS